MPIYEYQCPHCGHEFESIHKVSAAPPACPSCGGAVSKKISLAAFHLKGGGWYSDAYAGKDNKPAGEASKSAAAPAKTETAAPAKAEAAPAASKPSTSAE